MANWQVKSSALSTNTTVREDDPTIYKYKYADIFKKSWQNKAAKEIKLQIIPSPFGNLT